MCCPSSCGKPGCCCRTDPDRRRAPGTLASSPTSLDVSKAPTDDIDLTRIARNLLDERGERLYVVADVRVECRARLDLGCDALGPDLGLNVRFGGGSGKRWREAGPDIL